MEDRAQLDYWLKEWYAPAYKTACLVLGGPTYADDAVQEAFIRLWRFRDSIPDGEGTRPWIYRVVVNACLSERRKEQRHTLHRAEQDDDIEADAPGSEDVVAGHLAADAVRRALADLPEELRVPVVLRYYAGLSEVEIAIAIRRRRGTVKSRLHEARRRLASNSALAGEALEEDAQ